MTRAIQRSERFRSELLERGVLLIPLIWNSAKEELSKKGFGGSGTAVSANAPAAVYIDPSTFMSDECFLLVCRVTVSVMNVLILFVSSFMECPYYDLLGMYVSDIWCL